MEKIKPASQKTTFSASRRIEKNGGDEPHSTHPSYCFGGFLLFGGNDRPVAADLLPCRQQPAGHDFAAWNDKCGTVMISAFFANAA